MKLLRSRLDGLRAAGGALEPGSKIARRVLSRRAFLGRVVAATAGGFVLPALTECTTLPEGAIHIGLPASAIIRKNKLDRTPFYDRDKNFYLVSYDTKNPKAKLYVDAGVAAAGLMAIWGRDTQSGCRIQFCTSSQWFEDPCHGSKFNRAGEYKLGPAPRGLDRMKMTVEDDLVSVFTKDIVLGPKRGVDTTGQEKEGPFCV